MPQQSDDFADVIQRAQRVTVGDVSSPFGIEGNAGRAAFVPGRAPGVPDLDYEAHVSVFALPADAPDYEDVLNDVLRGLAIMRYEEKTFSKEGDFLVACCWLTPRARPAQQPNIAAGDAEPEARPQKLP